MEDEYVSLARRSLETYIKTGRKLSLESVRDTLPKELLEARSGAFVSLHKNENLRGCIGTIAPVCDSVAQEIIDNAVSAGTRDPRFPEVRADELDSLEISVDVLGETEPVKSLSELDVKRYGVIVTKGWRRGLLLPNLDGVDSVAQQIAIAKQKAGIGEDEEGVELERFEVVRHF